MTAAHSALGAFSPWLCPLCRQPLAASQRSLQCENQHTYDLAKEGYVNLLLANQKNSREPGDSAEMISARRDFFSTPLYAPLFTEIVSAVVERLQLCEKQRHQAPLRIVDLGCGEGAYLRKIAEASSVSAAMENGNVSLSGVDISKFAIKRAAKSLAPAEFAVASNYCLPLPDNSIDMALNVFAPLQLSELKRIMKETGRLLRVSPGRHHLAQIKQRLYVEAKEHEAPEELDGFRVLDRKTIKYTAELSPENLQRLLSMTPLHWRGNEDAKKTLATLDGLSVDFDFLLEIMALSERQDLQGGAE